VSELQGTTIEKALQNFGLTEKETQIYIYLAKHGIQKGGEIANKIKTAKSVVYRSLKALQRKGFIESTLESPVRFKAIPFEAIVDLEIKAKHEEAKQIETSKKDLLSDWKKISQTEPDSSLEKFSVIEGNKMIFHKISQMIKDAKNQFSLALTVSDLLKAEHFEVFSFAQDHPKKSIIKFRVITQLSKQNLKAVKILQSELIPTVDFRGRNPNLGLPTFTRMAIRDKNEIIIFISQQDEISNDSTCLCTNSKSIVNAFHSVFENLWCNSINLTQEFDDVDIGGTSNKIEKDSTITKKKLYELLNSAKNEIVVVTSSEGLKELPEENLQRLSKLGVSIKIMAPITNENLNSSKKLLDFCELRHVSTGYFPSILIDHESLFQLNSQSELDDFVIVKDFAYINKTKKMLNTMWNSAYPLPTLTISKFLGSTPHTIVPNVDEKSYSVYRKTIGKVRNESLGTRKENEIIREFLSGKKYPVKDITKDVNRAYQSTGHAIVNPPSYFNLPKMLFHFFHVEKKSSYGEEDAIRVEVWMDTPNGPAFVPAAMIGENPKSKEAFKIWFRGTPAADNVILVDRDEIEIKIHGNTMFAAWTFQIPLMGKYLIPPACIVIEGYGNLKTSSYVATLPSGFDLKIDTNGFDAFVTFIHPKSKYSGPGTEGYIGRDEIMEIIPPPIKKQHVS
jgi:sugar-specific transcriptional regulator TrmB